MEATPHAAGIRSPWTRGNRALARAAERISALKGWRRRGAAFLAGAAASFAFAPFYLLPLMAAGFTVLVLLIDGAAPGPRRTRTAFHLGWFFGFGHFLVGVYWMAFSFFVQAEEFAWMSPFAVLGMPAFLGIFSGGACAVAAAMWRPGWPRVLLFAGVWMVFEYARGHVLTGLPWNLPGQAFAGSAMGAQTAAWYGAYGLSLVTMTIAAAPAAAIARGKGFESALVCAAGAAVVFTIGALRLAAPGPGDHESIFVRIVQPNIPQREKIDPAFIGRNFRRQVELSQGETAGSLYILWPENAAPLIDEAADALEVLSEELPKNAILITGSVRREISGDAERFYNSLAIIPETPAGRRAVDYYDKHHLVPFGEYLPFDSLLRAVGLAQLAPYDEGFAAGPGPKTLSVGSAPFAALICYEAIFPNEIYPKGARPEWIATVTNDAWFGDTSGPRQHLDQARLRSIETGLPMARSANTGISALIDARGRLVGRVKLYSQGRIDAALPKALPPTLYTRIGDSLFLILSLVVIWLGCNASTKRESAE